MPVMVSCVLLVSLGNFFGTVVKNADQFYDFRHIIAKKDLRRFVHTNYIDINVTMAAFTTTVAGEGTYGCVLRPPLACSRDQDVDGRLVDYTGKVSKLMDITDAKEEQDKYHAMEKIDPNHHFHYPTPMRCFLPKDPKSGEVTDEVQDRIRQCKAQEEIIANLDNYQVLLMQDGGVDILGFTQQVQQAVRSIVLPVTSSAHAHSSLDAKEALQALQGQVNRLKRFWENAINLFYGLQRLRDAPPTGGWVHHDLKPHNVVYLEEEDRVAMIDFGMLQRVEDMVRAAKNNDYDFARFHWNVPPEMFFYHRIRFTHLQRMSDTDRATFYMIPYQTAVLRDSVRNQHMREKVDGRYPDREYNESLRSLAKVLNIDDNENSIRAVCMGFMQFFQDVPRDVPFEDFLQRSISTLDVYGLGIALLYVMNHVGDLDDGSLKEIHDDLMNLFNKMCDANLYGRLSIDKALAGYQEILHKHRLRVHQPPVWEPPTNTGKPGKSSKLRVRRFVQVNEDEPSDSPGSSLSTVFRELSDRATPSPNSGSRSWSRQKIQTPDAPRRKSRHLPI